MGALPVGPGGDRLAAAIEQHRARDRELGGAGVQPVALGRRPGGELDQRRDRGIELGGRVVAVEGGIGDLGEHRVGLGRGLATGQRGAPQAGAGLVGPAERDQRTRERELVARRDRLGQPQAAQPLVQRDGDVVIVAVGGGGGEADQRGLQRIELERPPPRVLGGGALRIGGHPRIGGRPGIGEQATEPGPRARRGPVIAAQLGEPGDLAPRGDRSRAVARGQDRRGHLVDRRIVGGPPASGGELALRGRRIAELVDEHVGEPQVELHRPGRLGHRDPGPDQPDQLGPALLVGEPVGQRVRGLGRARIVLDRELVELGRGPRVEDAEQARGGERGERGLIVVAARAGHARAVLEVAGGLAGVALGEGDRRERRVRRGERRPPAQRLARQLEAIEEPRGARRREREDPLEQERLVRAARREQRAVAAHRILEVAASQLLVDRVHEVVRRGELVRLRADAELTAAHAGGAIRDLDRGARHANVGDLDVGDRRQPPAARREDLPQQRTDEVELDIAQPARVRPVGVGRGIAGAGQRDQHAVGDHRARGREVAVHPDGAGQRAEVGACAHQLDVERQVGGGQPVGRARAHRHVAVAQPGRQLGDADAGERLPDLRDALVEGLLRDPHREAAQPGAPALEPLGRRGARIGAEIADLELQLVDGDQAHRQVAEREPADPPQLLEVKRQAPRGDRSSLEHELDVTENRALVRPLGPAQQ